MPRCLFVNELDLGGDLICSASSPQRRLWTWSALNTVKLLREISALSTDGVSYVKVKTTIDGSLEGISKLISASLGKREQQKASSTVMACLPPRNFEDPISELEFATETFCGQVGFG